MNNTPLVSIAMCTYNGDRYLQQQINSLVDQTYPNIELVIVDDGSTDNTLRLLESYKATDTRITIHQNPQNLGYVKNFEKAISLCKGDYIALTDQDDIWELNKIEALVNNIGDAVLIYHDSILIDNNGEKIRLMSDLFNMYTGNSPLPFLFFNCISGHSMMFTKQLVSVLGAFDNRFYHDWWIAFVAANTGTVKYLDQALVKYRQHQDANTDILRSRKKSGTKKPKYSELNLPWLKNCERLDGRCQHFIEQLIHDHIHPNALNRLHLFKLLLSNFNLLFYTKKRSTLNKLNVVRKMAFYRRKVYYTLK
jgi:glycosyltransferase involved in cell wall biosynthesis